MTTRSGRILLSGLMIVLLIGLSAWDKPARVPVPKCENVKCSARGCYGAFVPCAIQDCEWCRSYGPITICLPGVVWCTTKA